MIRKAWFAASLILICASVALAQSSIPPERAFVNRNCVGCHNEKSKTGGLALDTKDLDQVAANAEVWEKVVRKLRARAMPPAGRPRPDEASYRSVISQLETTLDRAAALN